MYRINVTADGNDADYNTRSEDAAESDLVLIRKIAQALKEFKPSKNRRNNWTRSIDIRPDWPEGTEDPVEDKYKDILTLDEIEEFRDKFLPYEGEYGIHSVNSIEIIEIKNVEELL